MFIGSITSFLLCTAFLAIVVDGQSNSYFDDPDLKWSVQLEGSGTIESGNAVAVSPENTLVYVTSSDGRLDVLAASNGARRWSYTPTPIAQGWDVKCHSGVYFGDLFGVGRFAVYAIIDVPPPAAIGEDFQSRIIAVAHPTNEILWISDAIPGEVQGTPIVSRSFTMSGQYVFFTHNVNYDQFGSDIVGSFSIVHAAGDGALIFSEVAGDSPNDPAPENLRLGTLRVPYGPLGVAHDPLSGRYPGGEGNSNDLLAWSTSVDGGRGDNGYTRAFQLPALFQAAFGPNQATTFLREVRWNTAAPPVFSSDGLSLLFGVNPNALRGWTGLNNFDENANVVRSLEQDPNDPRAPIPKKPIISADDSTLFIFGTTTSLYGLDADSGSIDWTEESDSLYSGTINVSPDNDLLFTTQVNGRVSALRQSDGRTRWEIDCSSFSAINGTNCVDDLQGDFSLSPNGLVLYYGDRLGNVKALQIGESSDTTVPPTEFPTRTPTDPPTSVPSSSPTGVPTITQTSEPTVVGQTESPTIVSTDAPTIVTQESTDPPENEAAAISTSSASEVSTAMIAGTIAGILLSLLAVI